MRSRNSRIAPRTLEHTLCVLILAAHAATAAGHPEKLALSAMPSSSLTSTDSVSSPFSFGQRLGLIFIAQAAICSFLSVSGLLLYVFFNAIRNLVSPPQRPWRFLGGHVDVYFLNLLLFDLVQAVGGIMDIRWAVLAGVTPGPFCTAQGMLKNIGDVGVAFSTLAIAVHTSAVLLWEWKPPTRLWLSLSVIFCIWLFISLENGIAWRLHHSARYIESTGLWCWIGDHYPKERILFEYLWMWFTALSNLLLYIPLFLVLRGNLVIRGIRFRWRKVSPGQAWVTPDGANHTHRVARQMLWYPLAYVVVVLPIAIVRWLAFSGKSVPTAATIFSGILFCLSGLINSLLYPATRPALLPTRHRDRSASGSTSLSFSKRRSSGPGRQEFVHNSISFNVPRTGVISFDGSLDGNDPKLASHPSALSEASQRRSPDGLESNHDRYEAFGLPSSDLELGKEEGEIIDIASPKRSFRTLSPTNPDR